MIFRDFPKSSDFMKILGNKNLWELQEKLLIVLDFGGVIGRFAL
jgi:hypothetical protein